MSPILALFLVVFLGIFHVLGGAALGRGLRGLLKGSADARFFIVWGLGFGGMPLVMDLFFLVAQGYPVHGLAGPVLFVVSIFVSAYLELDVDTGALISAALGSAAFLLGLLSIPLMFSSAQTANLGLSDYLFSGCFVLMFVGIGGLFAASGWSAIVRRIWPEFGKAARGKRGG